MYTTQEAATALGVTRISVFRYTKLEKDPLPAIKIGMRFHLKIREDDLIEFAKKHGMDIVALKQQ